MADTEEVKVGEALLDYVEQVTNIISSLGLAESKINDIIEKFPNSYEGYASPQMESYLNSLYGHIQKMIFFYGNLATYINNVFETVEGHDQILAKYLTDHGYVAVEDGE